MESHVFHHPGDRPDVEGPCWFDEDDTNVGKGGLGHGLSFSRRGFGIFQPRASVSDPPTPFDLYKGEAASFKVPMGTLV